MKSNTVKTVIISMLIMLVGKVLGLLREMLFGFYYGTDSIEAAAFTVANQIPKNFLDAMFASVIAASFIPVFNDYYEKKGRDEAFKLSYNFLNIILLFSVIVTVLGMMFPYEIASWYADGYQDSAKALTGSLLRIMLPLIVLSGLAYSLVGVVQSLGQFNIPAAMSVVSNSIIILYYFLFLDKFGVYGLAAAFIVGWLLQLLMQLPFLSKNQFKYRFFIDFKEPGIKQIGLLMVPVMISSWIQPVNLTINAKVASKLFDGSGAGINALNYANTLYTVITGVFILSVANVIFPKLSKQNTNQDITGFNDTVYNTLHSMFYFLIPMCGGLIILAAPIVRLVFEISGGRFDSFSTAITSKALIFYSLGMLGLGVQTILSRGFYAIKDGVTPLITSVAAILINLALSIMLVDKMDVGGVALASSVSINLVGVIMIFVMTAKGKKIFDAPMAMDMLKMLLAAACMAFVAAFVKNGILTLEDCIPVRLAAVFIPAIVGFLFYAFATLLLKISEPKIAFNLIKNILYESHLK